MTAPPLRLPVRVTAVAEVAPLVKRFQFESRDGKPLPPFSGGAHVIVEIQNGTVVHRNAYSLMSPPGDLSSYAISVRRDEEGRGGSRLLHECVTPGMILQISHPTNLFPIDRRARKHLMIAGGIGVTPFLAMGEQLLREGACFELHHGVRSGDQGLYVGELRERFGARVAVYAGDRGERLPLDRLLVRQPLGTHLYVCGPSRLTDVALGLGRDLGWPESALHSERFTAPPDGKPYEVQLARSGKTISVGSHQSMLEAIEATGVEAPYLCRGGVCGQCETRVLSCYGRLLHADHYLSEDEKASGKAVMLCVSRFEGASLVLDL